jgi:hypothetical protein
VNHFTSSLVAHGYRIQEEAFGGLDRDTAKLLDRLARGEKSNELNRRLKPGTVLVREYNGDRHTVTVVPNGFLWQDATYSSLSTIARAIVAAIAERAMPDLKVIELAKAAVPS